MVIDAAKGIESQTRKLFDPMKQKHLARALTSLAEEGVTQVFKPTIGPQWIVGVVGPLQLDVLKSRADVHAET